MGANAAVASTAISAGSKAYAEHGAGRINSRLANFNASVSDLQAKDAIQRGQGQVVRLQQKTAVLKGQQTAGFAAQGVDVTAGGSVAQVAADTSRMSALDQLTIQNNAQREALGFEVQAEDARFRAKVDTMRGNNEAMATLLTAGNKATGIWGREHNTITDAPYVPNYADDNGE